MKIQLLSDLHLEFNPIFINNETNSDALIIAGDLCEWYHKGLFIDFIEDAIDQYDHIFYVTGNHEYFNCDINSVDDEIADYFKDDHRFKFLRDSFYMINDVIFVGGTLWTDLNKGDYFAVNKSKDYLNDYRIIHNIRAHEILEKHDITRDYITKIIKDFPDNKIVVITHHCPSEANRDPKYQWSDGDENYSFFCTDMEDLLLDNELIWVHGHSHFSRTVQHGKSTIMINAKGYGYENRGYDEHFTFEV
jgi:Icc-related predicted phosphoesterase